MLSSNRRDCSDVGWTVGRRGQGSRRRGLANFGNESVETAGFCEQQVAGRALRADHECVGDVPRAKGERSRACLNDGVTDVKRHLALENVERLVLVAMNVVRRPGTSRGDELKHRATPLRLVTPHLDGRELSHEPRRITVAGSRVQKPNRTSRYSPQRCPQSSARPNAVLSNELTLLTIVGFLPTCQCCVAAAFPRPSSVT